MSSEPNPGSPAIGVLEQVRDIAPEALVGRETEPAESAELRGYPDLRRVAGRSWAGNRRWRRGRHRSPGRGGHRVVFITGRLAGQADGDALLDAMIEQLSGPVQPTDSLRHSRARSAYG